MGSSIKWRSTPTTIAKGAMGYCEELVRDGATIVMGVDAQTLCAEDGCTKFEIFNGIGIRMESGATGDGGARNAGKIGVRRKKDWT